MIVKKIAVIGGGIGGLSAALALQRRGFSVSVYERSTELREIGAGLIVTANARRALADLGVDESLAQRSSSAATIETRNYQTGAITREMLNADLAKRYGLPSLQVHRGDLYDILLRAVLANDPAAVHAGHDFQSLEQDANGVSARFKNGVVSRSDALIGADGNASAVRTFLFPGERPVFNGQVAYRALIPRALVPASIPWGWIMHPAPSRYLLYYPLRGGTIMNLIGCGQANGWAEEGWSIPATNEAFAADYADFAPHLLELIHAIPTGGLFKWGLRDREPLESWVVGRVAMLGDAAHPMTPFLGQGACIAIEDGLVLARSFAAASTVAEALGRYENARKTRGTNVQLWSREEGRALQDPAIPRRTAADRGLLDYNPATIPI